LTRKEFDDYMASKYRLERRHAVKKKMKNHALDVVVADVELVAVNVNPKELTINPLRQPKQNRERNQETKDAKDAKDAKDSKDSKDAKEANEQMTEEENMIRDMHLKFKHKYVNPDDLADDALPTMRSGLGAARWQLAVMLIKYPLLRKYRRHRLLETLATTNEHSSNKWTEGAEAEQQIREQARSIALLRSVSRTSVVRATEVFAKHRATVR